MRFERCSRDRFLVIRTIHLFCIQIYCMAWLQMAIILHMNYMNCFYCALWRLGATGMLLLYGKKQRALGIFQNISLYRSYIVFANL